TEYGNIGSSLKWSRQWNSKLYSNTLVSFSNYFSNRNRSTSSSATNVEGDRTFVNNGTFENNNLDDYSAKTDWELKLNDDIKLLYGGFATSQHITYNYAQNDTSKLI